MSDKKIDQSLAEKFRKLDRDRGNISEFVEDYISEFSSISTRRAYKNDLNQFFNFLSSGGVEINHPRMIKDYHYKVYRDQMLDESKSSATVNRRLVSIRTFMKWAMRKKLIEVNPIDSIKLPKIQTESPTQAFNDEEVAMMIDLPDTSKFQGSTQRLCFSLLFYLGLRRSELLSIKRKDIRVGRRNTVLTIRGKGSKTRELPLAPKIQQEIIDYLDRLKDFGLELSPEDFLVQSHSKHISSKPVDGSTIYRWIKKSAQKLGINRRLSPHSCRATAISHLLDTRQVPIRDVAIFAGHENVNTTERYDKRRENLDKSAAYEVDYEDEHKKDAG